MWDQNDWYYATAAAAYAHGLASADDNWCPHRPVTRGEFTTILARAMEHVGWLSIPENGQAQDLSLADAPSLPSWALGAYLAFDGENIGIFTQRETGEADEDGSMKMELLAQWDKIATRGEAITFLHSAPDSAALVPLPVCHRLGPFAADAGAGWLHLHLSLHPGGVWRAVP